MKITLARLSDARHRLHVRRADGSECERTLETRSLLLHDLVHYAIEAEAGLEDAFWGRLAAGATFETLAEQALLDADDDLGLAERLVGPMQSVWNGRLAPDRYVAAAGPTAPFVDLAFVERVRARIRALLGQWRATGFHDAMTLNWPPG